MPSPGRYDFHVRSYELGPRGEASLASLCHLLQESASLHAHELDASPTQLLDRGMTWFLTRLRVRIDRYPVWRDAVTVETWPAELNRVFAIRDFRVHDARGEEIAVASSWWLLMDMVRRKPIRRTPREIVDLHPAEPLRALPGGPTRLPRLDAAEHEEHVQVRRADLDMNGHVNHVFYITQVEQTIPPSVLAGRYAAELEIEFKAECHDGDEIVARSQRSEEEDGVFLHSLVREGDQREVARAKTLWTPDEHSANAPQNRVVSHQRPERTDTIDPI